ncbi:cytochrome b5 isoform X2 [Cajanus cajan]|uniref:Cytochrome b5 isoform 1 n=2 Tax=Cajanus cajan TaxID=3821 RepID=A0A151TY23_CAJCA|nr:cytochrome b5 isoform X2 [Cajanus cajan]XP_029126993.1 cytochrome b5 isoform X2 [Cajanus cajan]KYP71973.1 Cytochrome b5 isoform 1 [Cajanus cajan]
MALNSKTLTFEEVAKHNHKKDCWIIVHGKVYDITPFLDDHPGGDEVLVAATEKDATIDFEDVGHSDSATEMMERYLIGKVDTATLPAKVNHIQQPPTQAHGVGNQSSGFVVKMLQFLLPLLLLGLAFALQHYGKKKYASTS